MFLDAAPSQLKQTWYGVGPFLNEPHNEGVVAEAKFLEVSKFNQVSGQGLELVVMETE